MARKLLSVLVLVFLVGCAGDPEAAKQKLLETGNKYFENEKYKEASIIYRRALQKDARYGEAYYRLGLSEQKLGRTAQALAAYTRTVELQPENEDAYGRLADLYLAIYLMNPERSEQVLADLQAVTEKADLHFPDAFAINRVKGFVALSQSRGERARESGELALKYFERAHAQNPESEDVALGLVESMALAGRQEEAMKTAREMLARNEQFGGMYDFLYAQHVRNQDLDGALRVLKDKVEHNPGVIGFQLQLAGHYLATRDQEEMVAVLDNILQNDEKFPNAYRDVGDFYARFRDYDRAVAVYRTGAEKKPGKRIEFRNKMVESLAAQGNHDEAYRLVGETLEEEPDNSVALALRGALRLQSRDRAEIEAAAADFESALARMPKNAVLRYNLAEAYRSQGDVEKAIVEYRAAISNRRDYLPPRYRLAGLQLARGEYGNAVASAEEILEVAPNNLQALLIRASAWARVGEGKQARDSLEAILKAAPGQADAVYQLAVLNLREKRYAEAETLFRQLYGLVPPDLRGLMGLVDVLMAQGRSEQAIQLLETNVAEHPEHRGLKLAAATTLNAVGRRQEAAAMLRGLLDEHPDDSDAHKILGSVYYSEGNLAEAETHLKRAQELSANDPTPVLYLGMLAERQGAVQQAVLRYEQVIELAPDNAVALNNLAFLLAESTSELDRALSLIQKARRLAPNDPNVADTLGYVYIKKNLPQSAIPILNEIVAQHPSVVVWRYHLAMALRLQGDLREAKQQLEIALGHGPTDEEKLNIRELLAQVGT